MTQKEFDALMCELNEEQTKVTMPIKLHIDGLQDKAHELRAQILEIQLQLQRISQERFREEKRLKEINTDFYLKKHELVKQAPPKQPKTEATCPLASRSEQ